MKKVLPLFLPLFLYSSRSLVLTFVICQETSSSANTSLIPSGQETFVSSSTGTCSARFAQVQKISNFAKEVDSRPFHLATGYLVALQGRHVARVLTNAIPSVVITEVAPQHPLHPGARSASGQADTPTPPHCELPQTQKCGRISPTVRCKSAPLLLLPSLLLPGCCEVRGDYGSGETLCPRGHPWLPPQLARLTDLSYECHRSRP